MSHCSGALYSKLSSCLKCPLVSLVPGVQQDKGGKPAPREEHSCWAFIHLSEARPSRGGSPGTAASLSPGGWWQIYFSVGASLMAPMVKNLPAMRETSVRSLDWEDPLEGMAIHSSVLAWRISMDRRTWQATVHGVAKSRTERLSSREICSPQFLQVP